MRKSNSQPDLQLQRRMQALGVPLELHEEEKEIEHRPQETLNIEQSGACYAVETDLHGIAYILELSIVSNLAWPVELTSFKLELPWQDDLFLWINDPQETDAACGMYSVPGSKICYARNQVLNHRIGPGRVLARGRSISGLLLGIGSIVPDAAVVQGTETAGFLRFWDQFGREYPLPVTLLVDRKPSQLRKTSRKPLFACRDR